MISFDINTGVFTAYCNEVCCEATISARCPTSLLAKLNTAEWDVASGLEACAKHKHTPSPTEGAYDD